MLDGERIYGWDEKNKTVHLFSFDAAVESPLLDSQVLDIATLCACSDGKLLAVDCEERRMIPFVPDDEDASLELADEKIVYTSSRGDDYFIVNSQGKIYFSTSEECLKLPSKAWTSMQHVAFDGKSLLAFTTADQRIVLYDFSSTLCSAVELGSRAKITACAFIPPANCCSQGTVPRLMIGDHNGLLSIYRIVQ